MNSTSDLSHSDLTKICIPSMPPSPQPCQTCLDLNTSYRQPARGWALTATDCFEKVYELRVSFESLSASAALGCTKCMVLINGIRQSFREYCPSLEAVTGTATLISGEGSPLEVAIFASPDPGLYDKPELRIQFYSLLERNGSLSIPQQTFGSAQHVPAERSLEDYTAIIQGWVHDCIQTHTKCGLVELSKSDLPFRVLCITGNSVVLVHAQDTVIDRYATLSHRWGQKHPVTTTEENIARWMEEIPWEELPKTFQDAIRIARGLGLSFIWIDSLCIIQDNPQDWEKEAARMATIYSNSHLNIAATSSIDALGGCIFSRKLPSLPLHSGDRRQILLQCSENTPVFVRPSFRPTHARFTTPNYAFGFSLDIRTFPLLARAWVFQERYLAPRTLHFHSTEIVMECRSHLRCECTGVDKVSAKRFDLETASDAQVLDQWMEAVEEYSKLTITKDSDRLPAILGVATRFQQRLRSRYIAGLWEVDLARQILWQVTRYLSMSADYQRPYPFLAPSWSWASMSLRPLGAGVSFSTGQASSFRTDHRFKSFRKGFPSASVGLNQWSSIMTLSLEAASLTPILGRTRNARGMQEDSILVCEDIAEDFVLLTCARANLDTVGKDWTGNVKDMMCLVIGSSTNQEGWYGLPKKHHTSALVVRASREHMNMYERVGVMTSIEDFKHFVDVPTTTVTLV